MSDIKEKREVKKIKSVKTKTKVKKEVKPKTYIKVITETKSTNNNKGKRACTIALITTFSIIFLFFLFNKTFFRGEYKVKNSIIDIPYFMIFSGDDAGVLTLKTWRNYDYIKSYFDEYLENLNDFDFYTCGDGRTLYFNEENELLIYNIDIKRNTRPGPARPGLK